MKTQEENSVDLIKIIKESTPMAKVGLASMPLDLLNQIVIRSEGDNFLSQFMYNHSGSFLPVVYMAWVLDSFFRAVWNDDKYRGPMYATLGGFGVEFSQLMGTIPGVSDPKDLLAALAGGVLSAYLISNEK